jgi:predicted DNA-binding protein
MQYNRCMDKKQSTITIRLPVQEKKLLEKHSQEAGRTITDVLREFIRGLGKNDGQ